MSQDPAFLLEAHGALGEALFWLGELASARVHFEQGIALYDPQQHRSLAFRYGVDPGVYCLSFAALTLWFLGYLDQALKKEPRSSCPSPASCLIPLVWLSALAFATQLYQMPPERSKPVRERAEAIIMLSTEQGFPFWLAWGSDDVPRLGAGRTGTGREGIAQIRQGLGCFASHGGRV